MTNIWQHHSVPTFSATILPPFKVWLRALQNLVKGLEGHYIREDRFNKKVNAGNHNDKKLCTQ